PADTVWLDAGPVGASWSRWTADLAAWAGRTVVAVHVSLLAGSGGAAGIAVNLGELRIADGGPDPVPGRPGGFAVERAVKAAGDTASVYLTWDFAPDEVARYDIFRRTASGRRWVGRTYDGAYCVSPLAREGDGATTRLELEAVSVTGRRSPAATTELAW
ncbi:MAG TPA: hypothetical protein VIU15_29165, partial [Streptomyces sp.]